MIGLGKLTDFAETAFESMQEDSPDDAILGVCILVCEVKMPDTSETAIFLHSTDRRTWIQRALMQEAQTAAWMVEDGEPDE